MKIVITGSSGFIGFHTCIKFLGEGHQVHGIDNENNYYDVNLKKSRRGIIQKKYKTNFTFYKCDISSKDKISKLLDDINPDLIINLAAQAGVRHSLKFPEDYTRANIDGFLNILEYAKTSKSLKHLVYASTSSVYGGNKKMPFKESDDVGNPLQYYAVTKRANELMAKAYGNMYGIPSTGLRFFTVYGPWGRPDMALFKFTENILNNKEIDVFNNGNHKRDFTYVSDIVEGIFMASLDKNFYEIKKNNINNDSFGRVINIGRGKSESLEDFINEIEINLGIKAKKNYLPIQIGDVPKTHASITKLKKIGYKPRVSISKGVKEFVDWYLKFYR